MSEEIKTLDEVTKHAGPDWAEGDPIFLVVWQRLGGLEFQLEARDMRNIHKNSMGVVLYYTQVGVGGLDQIPSLDECRRLYMGGYRWELARAADEDALEAKEKALQATNDFLQRLKRIMEESEHEGERAAARSLYEKITGKSQGG